MFYPSGTLARQQAKGSQAPKAVKIKSMKKTRWFLAGLGALAVCLLAALFLSGSAFHRIGYQPEKERLVKLLPGQSAAQEIFAVPPGFNSISLSFAASRRLLPWQNLPVEVQLQIISGSSERTVPVLIQRQYLPLGRLVISFAPQSNPPGSRYFLSLTNASSEPFSLWSGLPFTNSSLPLLALDGQSLPSSLNLSLGQSFLHSLPAIGSAALFQRAGISILVFLFFTLISLPLWELTHASDRADRDANSQFLYHLGLGMVIWLAYLWVLSRFSVRPTNGQVWLLPLLISSLALIFASSRARQWYRQVSKQLAAAWPMIAGILFTLIVCTVQFKDLYVPAWVDGLNHYERVTTLLRQGALVPGDIYPLAYHLLSAALVRVFQLSISEAMLTSGLWISVFSSLAVYPLAERIFHQPRAAWLAVLLYSFFTPFPAYLITWSRFPFFLGLGLLALACALTLEWLQRPAKAYIELAILLAGLGLSHYGTLIHWGAFVLCAAAYAFHPSNKSRFGISSLPIANLKRLLLVLIPILALAAVQAASLFRQGIFSDFLNLNSLAASYMDLAYTFWLTFQQAGWLVWILAGFSLLALLRVRSPLLLLLPVWPLVLGVLNLLQQLTFGTIISSWMNWIIGLCLPLALLAAWGIQTLAKRLALSPRRSAVVILFGTLAVTGFASQIGIVNPTAMLFYQPDTAAMQWIETNTAPDAVFWVKSFRWGQSQVPADAGGWIPAFTGRKIIWPPSGAAQADWKDFLLQSQAQYFYFSGGRGDFSAEQMLTLQPWTKVVYNRDGVQIWQMIRQP